MSITAERLRKLLDYDPLTGQFKWRINRGGALKSNDAGSIHHSGYRQIQIDGSLYMAQRLAWLYVYGEFPRNFIDHINSVKSDNAIGNLRDVSHSVNMQNQKKPTSRNKTGFLGVSFKRKMFLAEINIDGKAIRLGCFDNPLEAHQAYLDAKRKHHVGCTI